MTDDLPPRHVDCDFLVDLAAGPDAAGDAAFAECRIAGVDVTSDAVAAHAAAAADDPADPADPPSKIADSLDKATDVTLKRGVLDADQLAGWLGADRTNARTVRVTLRTDDRKATLASWILEGSRIVRFVGHPAGPDGSCVEVDELTLTVDRITPADADAAAHG